MSDGTEKIKDGIEEAIDEGKDYVAEKFAEAEATARAYAERPKPLKYVVGAGLAGFLLGAGLVLALVAR